METGSRWVRVGSYSNGLQADLAKQLLEDAEIPTIVKGDQSGIYGLSFQGIVPGGITIIVPIEFEEEARGILIERILPD